MKKAAKRLECVIVATGVIDYVSDGKNVIKIENGTAKLKGITGTGCMTGSLIGSFLGTGKNRLESAAMGTLVMGIAGELADEGNYFYGKNVCFTGTCSYGTRKELLQKIKDVGGIPSDSVTKKTEVLVVGQQDYRVVGEDGMSKKQEKAKALLDKGQDIEILSEIEFLSRI